ncbi:MAG: carbohydrate-binding family 9-like protein [Armatimonadota bacterium]
MDHPLPKWTLPHVADFAIGTGIDAGPWRRVRPVSLAPSDGSGRANGDSRAWLCWSDTHLYAAWRCAGPSPRCTFRQRDEPLYTEDVVELFVAPNPADPCRYFELEFNALATIFDAKVVHPTADGSGRPAVDATWNAPGLECFARTFDGHWEVEIAVPFAALGAPVPTPGSQWRGNAYRIEYGPPDRYLAWSPTRTKTPNFHVPARFGNLEFGR